MVASLAREEGEVLKLDLCELYGSSPMKSGGGSLSRPHSTTSSVVSSTPGRRAPRIQPASVQGGLHRDGCVMEAAMEQDWAYLCQTFGAKEAQEEKQYTELSPAALIIVEGQVFGTEGEESEVEVLEESGSKEFGDIDFVRTGVPVEEVEPAQRGVQVVGGYVAEDEQRVREALGLPTMVGYISGGFSELGRKGVTVLSGVQ